MQAKHVCMLKIESYVKFVRDTQQMFSRLLSYLYSDFGVSTVDRDSAMEYVTIVSYMKTNGIQMS